MHRLETVGKSIRNSVHHVGQSISSLNFFHNNQNDRADHRAANFTVVIPNQDLQTSVKTPTISQSESDVQSSSFYDSEDDNQITFNY